MPEGLEPAGGIVHPALLDACLQLLGAIRAHRSASEETAFLPVGWDRLWLRGTPPDRLLCHARIRAATEGEPAPGTRKVDYGIHAPDGVLVGEVVGLTLRRGSIAALASASATVDDLLYAVEWRPSSPARDPAEAEPGRWVIWAGADSGGLAADLARRLERRGQTPTLLSDDDPGESGVRSGERKSWGDFFRGLPEEPPFRGVVHLGAAGPVAGDASLAPDLEGAVSSALALVQGLYDAGRAPAAGTWFVTCGAHGREGAGSLPGSALWGFGRVAGRELEELGVRLLDLDLPEGTTSGFPIDELLAPDGESEVALRDGERWAPRLVRAAPASRSDGARVRPDRSYLVTGGLGGLGRRLAGWLANRGAGGIVLNGRRLPDAEAADAVRTLEARGAPVRVEIADVSDRAAVEALLRRIEEVELPPLGGVFHAAGVWSDGSLPNQDRERFARVLGPKALGGWNLHRATLDLDLDLFVLFSSLGGLIGNPGQASYAAANAFLDRLAAYRRALGLPGQSIAWGPWSDAGAAEEARSRVGDRLESLGVGWLNPERGFAALSRVLESGLGNTVVASMDWERVAAGSARDTTLLADLLSPAAGMRSERLASPLVSRLRAAGSPDREEILADFLREQVRAVLRLSSPPAAEVGFFDLGMDSLMAVDLRNRIHRALAGEVEVPNTAVFDFPNVRRLAERLAGLFEAAGASPVAVAPRTAVRPADDRIAVVGMACRFPGEMDLAGFWSSLASGKDLVTEGRRPGPAGNGEGGDASHWGAFIPEIDRFDAAFFRIAPVEAELMDPQQRLLLEVSWTALEDAGLDPAALAGSRTGVYAGITAGDYQFLLDERQPSLYLATGTSFATAIGRVAFTLGLEGPAITVDTACSASLVAIHQAVAGLARGEADLALAGGVNAILTPGPPGSSRPPGCCLRAGAARRSMRRRTGTCGARAAGSWC